MTRPRGDDWLDDAANAWGRAGLDTVVSLLEQDEANGLGLDREGTAAESKGVQFISFPIPDRKAPHSTKDAIALLDRIAALLERGRTVAVHCRQGLGRSGVIAAGLLVRSGTDATRAIEIVSEARGQSVPETIEQTQWIKNLPSAHLLPTS